MIEFINVKKSFKDTSVIDGINLTIEKGQFVVLIGPSGCGKTTCLKMINRLISPTSGKILIDGKDIMKEDPIELRRNIGYVIQQTGLFPHMTVKKNVSIVPKMEKWEQSKIEERFVELMKMIGMDPEKYANRYPKELSGGQKQRIGVARAFAVNPDVILMDEPFSALDPITRNQLQDELYTLQQKMQKTIVFVTHDISEAIKLGDKICLMKGGHILQYDTPENILKNPAKGFVEDFIGKNKIWETPEYIKASDIMMSEPVKAVKERTCLQGLEIMKANKVDSLMIVNEKSQLIGIVTSKDMRKIDNKATKLSEIYEADFATVNEDDSLIDIIRVMKEKNKRYIAVVNSDKVLCGLITRASLLDILSSKYMEGDDLSE